jgi:hypothetical protein
VPFRGFNAVVAAVAGCGLASCAYVPNFDVPNDPTTGKPTVSSIVNRLECELLGMVEDKPPHTFGNQQFLLAGDYQVAAALELDVTDIGELSPSFVYSNPITGGMFSASAGATLSKSRTQKFTVNLDFSMRDLYQKSKTRAEIYAKQCSRKPDTSLAGELGLEQTVYMAAVTPYVNVGGEDPPFGATVKFDIVRNVNAVGPTWVLEHFTGPGGFGKLGRSNTDTLTIAFAEGPARGTKVGSATPERSNSAQIYLRQLLTSQIASQLDTLTRRLDQ